MGRRDKTVFEPNHLKFFFGVLTIIILGASLFFKFYNKKLETENENLVIKSGELYTEYQTELANYTDIQIKHQRFSDIDQAIESIKDEYFGYAKDFEDMVASGKTNKRIAYITFDDGPYELTYKVLSLLEKRNIRATFFVIGEKSGMISNTTRDDIYKKQVLGGHTLGNHTYSHSITGGLYRSASSFMSSATKLEEYVYKLTGYRMTIWRFPGGSGTAKYYLGNNTNTIIKNMKARGYGGYVDWTAQDGDGSIDGLTSTEAYKRFTSSVGDDKIEVVLFHDYNYATYSILDKSITYLESKNYVMLPLFKESRVLK